MNDPFEISFELVNEWDKMLNTKGHCATYWEIAKWGYDQHEKALLDAIHVIAPQPYETDND